MWKEESFKIEVGEKQYTIQPICNEDHCIRFKVSTDCEYMFTLNVDENGQWLMEEDVTPLNEELIDQIGRAMEYYDVHSNQ